MTDGSEQSDLSSWDKTSYQAYLDERQALNKSEQDQAQLFDRSAITIATGALGLSLAFIGRIVENGTPHWICILYLAWFALILSVLLTLASFRLSVHAFQRQRAILDSENDPDATKLSGNLWCNFVEVANWVSLFGIVIGVALLAVFIGGNTFK